MIAVMVLGIGLIGVGALVSVGALQAQRASVDDHKAIVGQASVRDDVARGFLQAENWLTAAASQYMVTPSAQAQTLVFPGPQSKPSQYNLQPVAIDPLMVAQYGSQVSAFATDGGSPPSVYMQRVTINSTLVNWSVPLTTGTVHPLGAGAQQSCLSEDDLKFALTTNNPGDDYLPYGVYNTAGTKREYTGQYSWLATLVPAYGDLQSFETRNLMTMSVVVFSQRQFTLPPPASASAAAANPWSERALQVSSVFGNGFGGGDMTLSGSSQNAFNLRVGGCLMLGWMQVDVPNDGSGNPTSFSANATYASITSPKPARPMFRWYRILNAGPITGSGSSYSQSVTLSGTDLNMAIIVPNTMWAFVYDGAVAVYERTVRLEGPSMWTN